MGNFKFKIGILFLVCVLVFGLSGCASTTAYKTAISKFQDASVNVITSSRSYVSELNKIYLDSYLEDCINNKKSIDKEGLNEAQPLSSEALNLRLRALDQLTNYGKLLYALVSSTSPEELNTAFKDLGTSLNNIAIDTHNKDSNFSKDIGPVSEIFGQIAKDLTNRRIENALDYAVKKGAMPINKLILTIREEVAVTYGYKVDVYIAKVTQSMDAYNKALKNGENEASLRAKAEDFKTKLDLYNTLKLVDPKAGFDSMIKAHAALVKYARSSKGPKDLESLSAAMDNFVSSAKIIASAVAELKK